MAQKILELYTTSTQSDLIYCDAEVLKKCAAKAIQSARVYSFPLLVEKAKKKKKDLKIKAVPSREFPYH